MILRKLLELLQSIQFFILLLKHVKKWTKKSEDGKKAPEQKRFPDNLTWKPKNPNSVIRI